MPERYRALITLRGGHRAPAGRDLRSHGRPHRFPAPAADGRPAARHHARPGALRRAAQGAGIRPRGPPVELRTQCGLTSAPDPITAAQRRATDESACTPGSSTRPRLTCTDTVNRGSTCGYAARPYLTFPLVAWRLVPRMCPEDDTEHNDQRHPYSGTADDPPSDRAEWLRDVAYP
jgi:hypothetical protein